MTDADAPALTPEDLMYRAIALAVAARERGDHPFGALLADAAGHVLLEAMNSVETGRDVTGHAETNLVRLASGAFSAGSLADMTLVTSTEPCAMCAGAVYWSGIGRVVYGLGEDTLAGLTGADPKNPTLALPCREVFARGQRPVDVVGPLMEAEALAPHVGFWSRTD